MGVAVAVVHGCGPCGEEDYEHFANNKKKKSKKKNFRKKKDFFFGKFLQGNTFLWTFLLRTDTHTYITYTAARRS